MKVAIIYKSKYGSTKQYAEWLGESLDGAEVFTDREFDLDSIQNYDKIVLAGPHYARITISGYLEKNWDKLSAKPVFLFSVGAIPAGHETSKEAFTQIPEEIRSEIGYRKLPGRLVQSDLSWWEKFLLRAMKAKDFDGVDRSKLQPIIKWVLS